MREWGSRLTLRMILASGLLALIVGAVFAVLLVAIEDLRSSGRQATQSREELARRTTWKSS